MFRKRLPLVGSVLAIFVCLYFFYQASNALNVLRRLFRYHQEEEPCNEQNSFSLRILQQLNFSGFKKPTKKFKILRYYHPDWEPNDGQKCQDYCTFTRDTMMFNQSDLVLFYAVPPTDMTRAFPTQYWAMISGESPYHTHGITKEILDHHKFDWFSTVSHSSVIPWIYGFYEPFQSPVTESSEAEMSLGSNLQDNLLEFHHRRRKKIAWVVSNVNLVPSQRADYVEELSKYIQVDRYGRAFNGQEFCPNQTAEICFRNLSKQYKFYLAFENSRCKFYITEKLFRNALSVGMIPIVLGAHPDDYRIVAPPKSFIHVDNYANPKQLADYLHYLDRNDAVYATYFEWRKAGQINLHTDLTCRYCHLMFQLQAALDAKQNISNLFNPKEYLYFFPPSTHCIGSRRWITSD